MTKTDSHDAGGLWSKIDDAMAQSTFRDYAAEARPSVKTFYQLNHRHQTYDFVRQKEAEYLTLNRKTMGAWETLEFLNTLVDDSDPDLDLTQLDHALQTAESIRRANQPRWMIVTGLIHDLGKVLCLWGEPQWAVVGDTFPVGCAFSDKIVYPEFFEENADRHDPRYSTECGIYERNRGLEHVHMSWGHDEYLYHAVKDRLPVEAHYMLRYHSFYAAHREGAYGHLMNDRDREMFKWVRAFNRYDLYSKGDGKPDAEALKPYYQDLLAEYFPDPIRW
jgi:inositol oxygenase